MLSLKCGNGEGVSLCTCKTDHHFNYLFSWRINENVIGNCHYMFRLFERTTLQIGLSTFMDKNITIGSNGSQGVRYSLTTRAILYSTEACFSLMANLLVVFLFICRRHLLCNPHNRCILSLAITDILTSVSVLLSPRFVLGENFYDFNGHNYLSRELYCRILWNNCLPFALGVASLYTSVVLSFERWLAVRRSIFYKSRFKIRDMNVLIVVSWITGFIAECPVTIFSEGVYDQTTKSCRYTMQDKILATCLSTGLLLFQTVVPLTIITLAYIDVFRGIKTSLRFAVAARAENISGIKRLRKVTKVAAITTFVLAVCWLPCSVAFYHSLLAHKPLNEHDHALELSIGLLVFGNSCINPCIYVFSNPELRNALRDIFR